MASSVPDAQQEISLLDKVLTKLALTSEPELPAMLERFLGGILEKLESPHESTRNKVFYWTIGPLHATLCCLICFVVAVPRILNPPVLTLSLVMLAVGFTQEFSFNDRFYLLFEYSIPIQSR